LVALHGARTSTCDEDEDEDEDDYEDNYEDGNAHAHVQEDEAVSALRFSRSGRSL